MISKARQIFPALAIAILLIAILYRFLDLGGKPLHHDESLHAYYSWVLSKSGKYRYDPMLHGPLLYYQIALSFRAFGPSDAVSRLAPAVAGTLLVVLFAFFRRFFGGRAALTCMLISCSSPMLVYVSRFARHDMTSALCTLLLVYCTMRFMKVPRRRWVILGATAVSISLVNHELTYLTLATYLLALIYVRVTAPESEKTSSAARAAFLAALPASLLTFCAIFIAFYSSFYTNPSGALHGLPSPWDPQSSVGYWLAQHEVRRGSQPIYYYFIVLALYEPIPLLLGGASAIGGLVSFSRTRRFVSAMTVFTMLAYSVGGERMPWLSIHPLILLIVCCGFSLKGLRSVPIARRQALCIPLAAVAGFSFFNAWRLSYPNAADPRELAVFTQTQVDVRNAAEAAIASKPRRIYYDRELTWPLAWYLRTANAHIGVGDDRLDAVLSNKETPRYVGNDHDLHFRSWWIPPSGWPGFSAIARYYLFREIWGTSQSKLFNVSIPRSTSLRLR